MSVRVCNIFTNIFTDSLSHVSIYMYKPIIAVELRDGLLAALQTRPNIRHRTLMIALTLIDGINNVYYNITVLYITVLYVIYTSL